MAHSIYQHMITHHTDHSAPSVRLSVDPEEENLSIVVYNDFLRVGRGHEVVLQTEE